MPYITQQDQQELIGTRGPATAGELNFIFTQALIRYVERNGLCYQTINDIVGAMEGAKAEFQRRAVANYEDGKIHDNGDVYPPSMVAGV